MLIAVAEMVLAELAGCITLGLEQGGDRRVLVGHPFRRPRKSHLGQSGANRRLAGDESGAAGGAALLAVIIGEERALLGDAVDVGRAVAHHTIVVGADVEQADVVAPDKDDVGLLLCGGRYRAGRGGGESATVTIAIVFARFILHLSIDRGARMLPRLRQARNVTSPVPMSCMAAAIVAALHPPTRALRRSCPPGILVGPMLLE